MDDTLREVILAYRSVITERYQYHSLAAKYDLPSGFTPERVDQFRSYFLDHVYPHPDKRKELNDAFDRLDGYIKNPEKLLRLLLDSLALIFKYGRKLPGILNAGLKALKSFRIANAFERQLVAEANRLNLLQPYDHNDVNRMLAGLSRTQVNQFIEHNQTLFNVLYDRSLVAKIKEIVSYLITQMRKRPKVYFEEEVRGLQIGQEIIVKGDELFSELNPSEQRQMQDFVVRIERDALMDVFT